MSNLNYCGQIGQQVVINNINYYIGDVVKLTDKKNKVYSYFQLIWSASMFSILLHNPKNTLASVHPHGGKSPLLEAYIPLFHITEGLIPSIEIERIGNCKKSLNLLKRIKRKGLKPV